MRDAIHALKYRALIPAAARLGCMLASSITRLAAELPLESLVIPIPLHQSKFSQRGFNQARLLATAALARLRQTHPGLRLVLACSTVIRQRATDSQAGLTPRQRRLNVRGAFVVPDAQSVNGRNVLLVDDIFTTGATVRAAAQVLLRAGAARVWVATVSRARLRFDNSMTRQVYSAEKHGQEFGSSLADEELADGREMEDNQPSF